jgi:hypothetical protein
MADSRQNQMKKDDPIWKDLQRFIDSIHDEIRTAEPDRVAVDFWLFKIERRIKILKDYIDAEPR